MMLGEFDLRSLLLEINGEFVGIFVPMHGVLKEKKMHEAAAFPF